MFGKEIEVSTVTLSAPKILGGFTTMRGNRSDMTLRLSLTDRCNFRCRYCMPEDGVAKVRHSDLPSLEQLTETVLYLKRQFNVTKVKLTGGEPLVRPGISDLIRLISPHVEEVSMTTNGVLLPRFASELKDAGLSRVNISLDSLNPIRFSELTRGGRLSDTLAGIESAIQNDLTPVKLNAVLQRSGWREDVPALLDLAVEKQLTVRFIELMRTGTEIDWAEREYISADEVIEWINTTDQSFWGKSLSANAQNCHSGESQNPVNYCYHGILDQVQNDNYDGSMDLENDTTAPARLTNILWKGEKISVGWITPRSHPFCDSCNRLRLDAHGNLRRCLMDSHSLPLTKILSKHSEQDTSEQVTNYLNGKRLPVDMSIQSPMIAVGG